MRRVLPLTLLSLLLLASPAAAADISFSGSTVTYTAGPGESNRALASVSPYDTACAPLAAPCFKISDSGAYITGVAGGCVVTLHSTLTGDEAACPVPASLVVNLGDRDDSYWDWNGPSTIDAGAGNDNPIFGEGGDDVIRGGVGTDNLMGQEGNDTLDGGPGDDYLEGVPCGCEDEELTHGSDTYTGGGGNDSVTYEGRSENLNLSVNGVADDGAAGEGDNIGADIGTVVGGHGSDVMTGNDRRNLFGGGEGDDVLTGGGSDDQLHGGSGNDRVFGEDGQDVVAGGDGDDYIVGGPGVDRFWGEDVDACIPSSCASGQDRIEARDGNQEMIDCGPGTDSAVVDANEVVRNDLQLSNQCESIDGLAASSSSGAFTVTSAKVSGGRIVVKLTAPSAGTASVKATAGRLKVGSAKRKIGGPGAVTLKIKPSRAAARKHRLKVTLKIAFNAQTIKRTVTLRRG
jgi:RTX calcium-binding nonapeptide repeat (4 copies)